MLSLIETADLSKFIAGLRAELCFPILIKQSFSGERPRAQGPSYLSFPRAAMGLGKTTEILIWCVEKKLNNKVFLSLINLIKIALQKTYYFHEK